MALKHVVLLVLAWLGAMTCAAASEPVSEQSVRAAMVFNFIKFTEWPEAANGDSEIVICTSSGDPAQIAAMVALNDRRVRGKRLAVVAFDRHIDCDVIYVDSRQRWNDIRESRRGGHAMTMGGHAGFAANGGMVEILLQDGKPRFDINLPEAKRAGLRFYPQLLQLARRILE